ncbi:MAG: hypothetical protein IPI92_06480 [Gemmatimonadetes bacterium]|nr:hypothetical protein [Gemmatimonadota bacterium]MBK7784125.1 hypothetical protein [Gemmatimonadota bacterium]
MRTPLLFALLSLPACAGGMLYSTTRASSSTAPDVVFQCVQDSLKRMGYRRMQYDANDRWYLAEKEEVGVQVSSGLYRKTWMVLDSRVRPAADGSTSLEIIARTFEEYASARGPQKVEEKASSKVKLDAQALQQACAP